MVYKKKSKFCTLILVSYFVDNLKRFEVSGIKFLHGWVIYLDYPLYSLKIDYFCFYTIFIQTTLTSVNF